MKVKSFNFPNGKEGYLRTILNITLGNVICNMDGKMSNGKDNVSSKNVFGKCFVTLDPIRIAEAFGWRFCRRDKNVKKSLC